MWLARTRASHANRSRRLTLEALEDRSLPAILLAEPGRVLQIDGFTSQQRVLGTDTAFANIKDLAVASSGEIFVVDASLRSVHRIDPVTGTSRVISTGYSFGIPSGIAVAATGEVFVSDRSSSSGANTISIVRFTPPSSPDGTWSVTTALVGTGIPAITHLAPSTDGSLFAIDDGNNLLRLTVTSGNPVPRSREVIPTGLPGLKPTDIAAGPNGSVYLLNNGGTGATTGVFHLSPGNATFPWFNVAIATGGLFVAPRTLTTLPSGELLVADSSAQSNLGAFIRVSPSGSAIWTQSVALPGVPNVSNLGLAFSDAVLAAPASLNVTEDLPTSATFTTVTPSFRSLVYSIVTLPTRGTLTLDDPLTGRYTYTPHPDAFGTDLFSFRVLDGGIPTLPATVLVSITPVNDPPVVSIPATLTLDEDTSLTGTARDWVNDVDGDALSFNTLVPPAHGSLIIAKNGTFTYTPAPNYNGADSFSFVASDGKGGFATGQVSLTIQETSDPPIITPPTPFSMPEGGSVQLTAAASSPDGRKLTYSWDFNADGVYEVTRLGSPSVALSWADLGPLGVMDSGTYSMRLLVEDGRASTLTDATLIITNAAPTALISGPSLLPRGGLGRFLLSASDPAPADNLGTFTYSIDWGDDTFSTITGPASHQADHFFTSAGTFTIRVTATDQDGETSTIATHSVMVQPVALLPNPLDPTRTDLHIGGTPGNDILLLRPASSRGRVEVLLNGLSLGSFSPTGSVVVEALAGDDKIVIQNRQFGRTLVRFAYPVVLHGGEGNDLLNVAASSRHNILRGGEGNDTLIGGTARDLLLGGNGRDTLDGGNGDDLLIGGFLPDESLSALQTILTQWSQTNRSYSERITALQSIGLVVPQDDAASDSLFGRGGSDWFLGQLADPARDLFFDRLSTELLTSTAFTPAQSSSSNPFHPVTVRIESQSVVARGSESTFFLRATAPFPYSNRSFRFSIDWGDGTTQQLFGPAPYVFTRRFDTAGTFPVTVTARADNGQVSQPAIFTVEVWATRVLPDLVDPSRPTLHVRGTAENDRITLRPATPTGGVEVLINGVALPPFLALNRVIVEGLAGNDTLRIQNRYFGRTLLRLNLPVVFRGGEGDDSLDTSASFRNNILDGGLGNDTLLGGFGADLLLGGPGQDKLLAGAGSDLLIAGALSSDSDPDVLLAVAVEWTRKNRSYHERIRTLSQPGVLNLVEDDTIDQLFGGTDTDWLIGRLSGSSADRFLDRLATEVRTALA